MPLGIIISAHWQDLACSTLLAANVDLRHGAEGAAAHMHELPRLGRSHTCTQTCMITSSSADWLLGCSSLEAMPTIAVDNRIKHDEVGLTAGTDRQTGRQTDRQADRQTDRPA